jgi:uncharacterized membrane protein
MRKSALIVLVAVALGVFFRFYHIDRKVYWGDETLTSMRMLGETEADLLQRTPRVHDVRDLQLMLHPIQAYGSADPLSPARGLALEEAHHPPLYFEVAHFWAGAFGNSIAATRTLSAIISLLVLPLAFWLGVEIYGSRQAGYIAVALFALSPTSIVFAQEAREYALWGVALLALNAALLRALRRDRPAAWCLVAVLTAFSLYVFTLTFLPLAGLAGYALATRWKSPKALIHCALAFAAGTIAFLPWLFILLSHRQGVADSLAATLQSRTPPADVLRAFAGLLRLDLLDTNAIRSSALGVALTAVALVVLGLAIAYVLRHERPRVSLFLVLPLLATTLPLLVLDLVSGGQSVRSQRYFTPAYIYLDYVLVGAVYLLIAAKGAVRPAAGYVLLVGLLAARTASAAYSSQAITWWNKMQDNSLAVASAIDRAERPIVVSDAYLGYALVLSNYLRPDIAVVLRPPCYECGDRAKPKLDASVLPPGRYSDVFALGPSPQLQALLRKLIVEQHLGAVYHCINVRHSCVSDLNVEPLFAERPKRRI